MYKPESVPYKIIGDFETQKDHSIPARIPDLVMINKKKKRIYRKADFAIPGDRRVKIKEIEKRDKYLDLAKKLKKTKKNKKKTGKHESTGDKIVIGALWTVPKGFESGEGTGRIGNRRKNRNYPSYRIVKIGQITEKSPGDLRRLVVTQIPYNLSLRIFICWLINCMLSYNCSFHMYYT